MTRTHALITLPVLLAAAIAVTCKPNDTTSSTTPGGCGDGVWDSAKEECDDKNATDGDGCSNDCKIEAGWACANPLNLNTGAGPGEAAAPVGSNDTLWSWSDSLGGSSTPAIVSGNCAPGAWHPPPAFASWVSRYGCSKTSPSDHDTFYQATFTLTSDAAASHTALDGTIWADNAVTDVYVNGTKTGFRAPDPAFNTAGISFGSWPSTLYKGGQNTLTVVVHNAHGDPNGLNPDGLLVVATDPKSTASRCSKACGDGVVESGEQCDDGPKNGSPGDACGSDCRLVVADAGADASGDASMDAASGDASSTDATSDATSTDATSDATSTDASSDVATSDASDAGTGAWTFTSTGDTRDLSDIWGSGVDDIYVVGIQGAAYHGTANGTTWTRVTIGAGTDQFFGVWGTSATNVYVVSGVTGAGTIYRYDGASWTSVGTAAQGLFAVWGSGPNDVYAIGAAGTIMHSTNGTTFSAVTSGTTTDLLAIWGSGASDVYAVGGMGGVPALILHYDGASWSSQYMGATTHSLDGIWGVGSTVYVADLQASALLHTTTGGATWLSDLTSPTGSVGLYGVWGSSASDVYVAGATASSALIAHYGGSGTTLTVENIPATTTGDGFTAMWGSSAANVYAVGTGGRIAHKQ